MNCAHATDEWQDCEIHPEGCYKTVCTKCHIVTYRDCDPKSNVLWHDYREVE